MGRPRRKERFGAFLKKRREALNLTAAQVVLRMQHLNVHLDNSTLYNWESGSVKAPDPAALWALGRIYKVTTDSIIELLIEEPSTSEPIPFQQTEEEQLAVRIRGLRADGKRRIIEAIEFEEHKLEQSRGNESGKEKKNPGPFRRSRASDS